MDAFAAHLLKLSLSFSVFFRTSAAPFSSDCRIALPTPAAAIQRFAIKPYWRDSRSPDGGTNSWQFLLAASAPLLANVLAVRRFETPR